MVIPQPRDADGPARGTVAALLWIAGLIVMFAPATLAIAYLLQPWRADGPVRVPAYDELRGLMRIGSWIAAGAIYLAMLQAAPRLGRTRGHRFRRVYADPRLALLLWLAHVALSWAALGLPTGRIDVGGTIAPSYLEQGIGAFLVAAAVLLLLWGYGRYGRVR
jgi:hypothetical protein